MLLLGREQVIKQACNPLRVWLSTMLLHIPLFRRANGICAHVSFKSGGALWLRVLLPWALLKFLGGHNPSLEAITRSAQLLTKAVKIMNHTHGFKGSATAVGPAL